MTRDFFQLFPRKSIIGMIHLAGFDRREKVRRALEEISLFEDEGIHGAIVEDYHGSSEEVEEVLNLLAVRKNRPVVGVNVLRDPWLGLSLANLYGAKFVQFDTINSPDVDSGYFARYRAEFPDIAILGGVRFKYIKPTGRSLEEDITEGMSRCEAIVTTGEGTGIETPTQKLKDFRNIMGNRFPLVVGAGVNPGNLQEQMEICDSAIIGSYFKNGHTKDKVYSERVREIMKVFGSLADKTG